MTPACPTPDLCRLIEDSSGPVYVMDPQRDRILDANRAGCELLGYTRDELVTMSSSSIHPAELPALKALVDSAVNDGQTWTVSLSCRTKSGRFLPTEIALHALRSGDRVYLVGMVRDRSEHRGP
jgi:two-component system, chemotaxis family, sensor kinase Cph1